MERTLTERLLIEEFPWDKENLVLEDPVIAPQPQIAKESVKSALTKMKKSKASGKSGVVTEMLLASGDAGLETLVSLTIIKEMLITSEWDTSVIVNCLKHKGETCESERYK